MSVEPCVRCGQPHHPGLHPPHAEIGCIDALLTANEALRGALAHEASLHAAQRGQGYRSGQQGGGYGIIDPACTVCGEPDEYAVPWPCAARRRLDEAKGNA